MTPQQFVEQRYRPCEFPDRQDVCEQHGSIRFIGDELCRSMKVKEEHTADAMQLARDDERADLRAKVEALRERVSVMVDERNAGLPAIWAIDEVLALLDGSSE